MTYLVNLENTDTPHPEVLREVPIDDSWDNHPPHFLPCIVIHLPTQARLELVDESQWETMGDAGGDIFREVVPVDL